MRRAFRADVTVVALAANLIPLVRPNVAGTIWAIALPRLAWGALLVAALLGPLALAPWVALAALAVARSGTLRGSPVQSRLLVRLGLVGGGVVVNGAVLWVFFLGGHRPLPAAELEAQPLRAHTLLADVPLHDVWVVRLRGGGGGRTVLLFDYRGYGRSTGSPSEEGTYLDARAAQKALPTVDAPIIYLGVSLGGAVAAALAVESPPDGLILQSTFTSVRDMARIHYPFVPASFVPDAYTTLRRVARVRVPTLFIHGESDRIVPVRHSVELHRAAAGPKCLERVPGADHNDVLDTMGPRYGQLIVEWIESWTSPARSSRRPTPATS